MVEFITTLFLLLIPPVFASSFLPTYNLDANSVEVPTPCVSYKMITLTVEGETQPIITCVATQSELRPIVDAIHGEVEFQTPEAPLWSGKNIIATQVQRSRTLIFENISHAVVTTYLKTLPDKKKVVTQRGKNGTRGKIVETTAYPDGRKVSKVLYSWVEREPVTEQLNIGTTHDYKTAIVDGKKIQYWKTLTVRATSYDSSCFGCNHTTATGAYLKKGVVAVDPRVIPMHTKMYIPGYGFGQAEDTGGAVKGNRIDLAFDDIRKGNWSRRDVMIYIID